VAELREGVSRFPSANLIRTRPEPIDVPAHAECELLHRHRFATQAAARLAVFDYIEGWYNPRRRHSALGYLSPIAFERRELVPA
jgi:transposase InsO family protein